jgi:uncharacterized membrane protein
MDLYTKVPKPPSLAEVRRRRKTLRNVNLDYGKSLSLLDKLALFFTERVGTMEFFLIILSWTVLWTGYNVLATEVRGLHWKPFDRFPAFVAYLLISNVIQILLMPLIMVGQNLQGRHAEKRAESDFEVNVKAEQEIEVILHHLEYQNAILITMLEKLGVSPEEAIAVITKHGMPLQEASAAS